MFSIYYFCLMSEARGGIKLYPAIKVYGKVFYDKTRMGHGFVFREIFDEYLPKKLGRIPSDEEADRWYDKGKPEEGFAFFHPETKEIHFLSRDEAHKKLSIYASEQL
jgi:hypothetical protein